MQRPVKNIRAAYLIKPGIPNPFCNYPTLAPEVFSEVNGQRVVDAGTPVFLNGDSRSFVTEIKNPRTRKITRLGEVVCINRTQPIKLRSKPDNRYDFYGLQHFLYYPPTDIPPFKYEVTHMSGGPFRVPQYGRIHSAITHDGKVIGYYIDLIDYVARDRAGNYGGAAMGERVPIAWTHIGKLEPNRPTNLGANFEELLGTKLPPPVTSGWGRRTRRRSRKMRKTRKGRRV